MTYEVEPWGGCLGEWIADGVRLRVDPSAPISPRDLVSVVFTEGDHPWARFMSSAVAAGCAAATKIFMGKFCINGAEMILLGQVSPPVVAPVPVEQIEALHKVVGACDGKREMTAADTAALAMISGFFGKATIMPINPGWRPANTNAWTSRHAGAAAGDRAVAAPTIGG